MSVNALLDAREHDFDDTDCTVYLLLVLMGTYMFEAQEGLVLRSHGTKGVFQRVGVFRYDWPHPRSSSSAGWLRLSLAFKEQGTAVAASVCKEILSYLMCCWMLCDH